MNAFDDRLQASSVTHEQNLRIASFRIIARKGCCHHAKFIFLLSSEKSWSLKVHYYYFLDN